MELPIRSEAATCGAPPAKNRMHAFVRERFLAILAVVVLTVVVSFSAAYITLRAQIAYERLRTNGIERATLIRTHSP